MEKEDYGVDVSPLEVVGRMSKHFLEGVLTVSLIPVAITYVLASSVYNKFKDEPFREGFNAGFIFPFSVAYSVDKLHSLGEKYPFVEYWDHYKRMTGIYEHKDHPTMKSGVYTGLLTSGLALFSLYHAIGAINPDAEKFTYVAASLVASNLLTGVHKYYPAVKQEVWLEKRAARRLEEKISE